MDNGTDQSCMPLSLSASSYCALCCDVAYTRGHWFLCSLALDSFSTGKNDALLPPDPVERWWTVATPHARPAGKISLIFTDIEDSSRMTNALGNRVYLEDMRAPHQQRIRDAITAHNGYEVKTMGDAFM